MGGYESEFWVLFIFFNILSQYFCQSPGNSPRKQTHEVAGYHTVAAVFQHIGSNEINVSEQPHILDPCTYDHYHFNLKQTRLGYTTFVWSNVQV